MGRHLISPLILFVCVPLFTCLWGFSHATACTAVHRTNSFPAFCLPDPLYLPRTEKIHKAISITARVRTSIGATQEIPELHVGSQYAEARSTAKSWMSVRSSPLSLHFLVVLYAVTYRRVKAPAHWMFRTDTPGGLSFISKLLPPPS